MSKTFSQTEDVITEGSRSLYCTLPTPRFTNSTIQASDIPLTSSKAKHHHHRSSTRRGGVELTLTTLPAIQAYLSREYSEAQLNRVPPVFVAHLRDGGGVYLAEPYSLTLKKAVKSEGESVLVKPWQKDLRKTKGDGKVKFVD